IINRWFDLILNTYPQQTAEFVKTEKNQFANPVGWTIRKGIEGIFDGIIQNKDVDKFLEDIIKIKAVQGVAPSQAISFIFVLKQAIREKIGSEDNELLALESKIDRLATISFDIFMKCREKIYQLQTNEMMKWGVQ
ncbi:MAG: RsbRD N-terminal domain-containing protein, partial [bacterium]